MSILGLDFAKNMSLYAIPAGWVLSLAPHAYAMSLYNSEKAAGAPAWDIRNPKKNLQNAKEAKLSPQALERYTRAEAAQENGFINLSFFAAAVIAGNVAHLSSTALNTAAGVYLASRVVYNLLYINNDTEILGHARTGAFLTGVGACFTLFIKAGNNLYNARPISF